MTSKKPAKAHTRRPSAQNAGGPKVVRESSPEPVVRVRKSMRLSQELLDEAREALGLEDETETVTAALKRIVGNKRVADGIRALGGSRIFDESRIRD